MSIESSKNNIFTTLMALIVLIKLLFIKKRKTVPCWRLALLQQCFEMSNMTSYAKCKRRIKTSAALFSRADGAELVGPFSMHTTLDQDPLLGSGGMPATLHIML